VAEEGDEVDGEEQSPTVVPASAAKRKFTPGRWDEDQGPVPEGPAGAARSRHLKRKRTATAQSETDQSVVEIK
jgi:hypothetical protein